jgi:hypothetical protein
MIKYLIKSIKCKINGHKLIDAGSCPFTGLTYNMCINCENMFSIDKKQES